MLTFVNPWGLLALLAVPVILAIHLFRRRYPVRRVAGLFLWTGTTRIHDAGRVRDRLPLTASLLLEVLAVILLALMLAQPRFSLGRRPHLVVVLDDSASMSATLAPGVTVRERAIREIEERVEELGRRTVPTIITTGRRPAVIAGPAASWGRAREQLETWRPTSRHHDPAAAWELGRQLAGREAELLFLTDAPAEESSSVPARMEIVALGEPNANLAIASARWAVDSRQGTGEILGHITNFADEGVTAELIATRGGNQQFRQTMTLPPGATQAFDADVPVGLGKITLRLDAPDDHLAIDDIVTLIEPKTRVVHVANQLPDGHPASEPLRRALAAIPGIELVETNTADLIITDRGARAPSDPDAWWLALGAEAIAEETSIIEVSVPVMVDTESPLLAGVTFDGVTKMPTKPLPFSGVVLAWRGQTPLVARRTDTPTRAYALNIDFASSNLAKSPDWPIFISNLVSLVRQDLPGLRRWNYRAGESISLKLPRSDRRGDAPLTLAGPAKALPIPRTRVLDIPPPHQPGVYQLRDGEREIATFAVNFHDERESNLRTRRTHSRPARDGTPKRGISIDSLHSWPITATILLVIMGLLGNWYLLSNGKR